MLRRLIAVFEPFVLMLLATVLLASFLPVRGAAVPVFEGVTDAAIVLLFFLHGAKLSVYEGGVRVPAAVRWPGRAGWPSRWAGSLS